MDAGGMGTRDSMEGCQIRQVTSPAFGSGFRVQGKLLRV